MAFEKRTERQARVLMAGISRSNPAMIRYKDRGSLSIFMVALFIGVVAGYLFSLWG